MGAQVKMRALTPFALCLLLAISAVLAADGEQDAASEEVAEFHDGTSEDAVDTAQKDILPAFPHVLDSYLDSAKPNLRRTKSFSSYEDARRREEMMMPSPDLAAPSGSIGERHVPTLSRTLSHDSGLEAREKARRDMYFSAMDDSQAKLAKNFRRGLVLKKDYITGSITPDWLLSKTINRNNPAPGEALKLPESYEVDDADVPSTPMTFAPLDGVPSEQNVLADMANMEEERPASRAENDMIAHDAPEVASSDDAEMDQDSAVDPESFSEEASDGFAENSAVDAEEPMIDSDESQKAVEPRIDSMAVEPELGSD